MIAKTECCVVVPLYKKGQDVTVAEWAALQRLYDILGQRPICFVVPKSLDITGYQQQAIKAGVAAKTEIFDDFYFADISGYNRLLTSTAFYQRFSEYVFILIYQTDAYVFRDEVSYWANEKYDYVGAPWFEGWDTPVSTTMIAAGNGGFSLRNVKKAGRILSRLKYLKRIFADVEKQGPVSSLVMRMLRPLCRRVMSLQNVQVLQKFMREKSLQEDIFWARQVPLIFKDFSVAPPQAAAKFSFESNPSYLYKMNGGELPFGCHAPEKYEPEFWSRFIKSTVA